MVTYSLNVLPDYVYIFTLSYFPGNAIFRSVSTEVPQNAYAQQSIFIIPVLIQSILPLLTAKDIKILQQSLKIMNNEYKNGFSFSDLENWYKLPNMAIIQAVSSK
jgi:hypothetical protein